MKKPSIKEMEDILNPVFSPIALKITDDSKFHIGHAGAKSGAGHFSIYITSKKFVDTPLIECHRMVYECFKDYIPTKIHALSIHCKHK